MESSSAERSWWAFSANTPKKCHVWQLLEFYWRVTWSSKANPNNNLEKWSSLKFSIMNLFWNPAMREVVLGVSSSSRFSGLPCSTILEALKGRPAPPALSFSSAVQPDELPPHRLSFFSQLFTSRSLINDCCYLNVWSPLLRCIFPASSMLC